MLALCGVSRYRLDGEPDSQALQLNILEQHLSCLVKRVGFNLKGVL